MRASKTLTIMNDEDEPGSYNTFWRERNKKTVVTTGISNIDDEKGGKP